MRRLLALVQVVTNQYWIGYSPAPIVWFRRPLRSEVYDPESDEGSLHTSRVAEPLIDRKFLLTADRWAEVGRALNAGEEAELTRQLWLEAHAFKANGNLRAALLSCTIACEVAIKTYLYQVHGATEPLYRYVVERDRELSIFDYLDDVLALATGQEPKQVLNPRLGSAAHKTAHHFLKKLFEARNKVAHEGRAYVKSQSGSTITDVNEAMVDKFLEAASGLMSWLANERRLMSLGRGTSPTPVAVHVWERERPPSAHAWGVQGADHEDRGLAISLSGRSGSGGPACEGG